MVSYPPCFVKLIIKRLQWKYQAMLNLQGRNGNDQKIREAPKTVLLCFRINHYLINHLNDQKILKLQGRSGNDLLLNQMTKFPLFFSMQWGRKKIHYDTYGNLFRGEDS